ncbi:unnamed protein product [Lathyrus oleraceus]
MLQYISPYIVIIHFCPFLTPSSSFSDSIIQEMASEAPSWADQWGAGGFGAMEDDNTKSQNDAKMKNSGGKGGLSKARATASNCVKWFKSLCKRKTPTKQLG